jgi:hypothetical protein
MKESSFSVLFILQHTVWKVRKDLFHLPNITTYMYLPTSCTIFKNYLTFEKILVF